MRYDTFHTMNYHGVYIHSKYDRVLKCEIFTVHGREFKSLRAAKCYATRCIKSHDKAMKEAVRQGVI